jgi:thioredoxin-related protein
VSLDQDESEFKAFFKTMSWVALPFSFDRKELAQKLGVTGIPTLVIMNKLHGCAVNMNGRTEIA